MAKVAPAFEHEPGISRRWLLKTMPAAAGVLAIGCAPEASSAPETTIINPFFEMDQDGHATLYCPEAEMGQDVYTGLPKVLADEIGLDWAMVGVKRAPHDTAYYGTGRQNTGSSQSMRRWYMPFREMGAQIRQAFINAAARRLDVAATQLRVKDSLVIESSSGKTLPFTDLLEDVAGQSLPKGVPLKTDGQLTLIGRDVPRKDIPAKVTGKAVFGTDVRLPGQVYAAVKAIPEMLGEADVSGLEQAKEKPGVVGVEQLGNAVAVVAETWWAAQNALKDVTVTPRASDNGKTDDQMVSAQLDAALLKMPKIEIEESADTKIVRASYDVPYLAHLCMEPMTATVSIGDGEAHVLTSTQSPSRFAMHVADFLGLEVTDVTVENMFLGGGFGRKGTDKQAVDYAVKLAQRFKRPVQVIMDRETDIQTDQFRPAAKFECAAELAEDGSVKAIETRGASQSILRSRLPQFYRPGIEELPEDGAIPYDMANGRHHWHEAELPISIGFWRSVFGSHYPFATESFIDEMAQAAALDPLTLRLDHLAHKPRLRTVLKQVAKDADWNTPRAAGTGLGIGLYEGWGSYCAQIAQVSIDGNQLTVDKVWAAIDCGRVISPNTVHAQLESGISCGLNSCLIGEINFEAGQAVQTNFDSAPIMTMAQAPDIAVTIMQSQAAPGGIGEIGTPPTAPAVANAVFAASGQRIRSLPLSRVFDI